MTVETRRLGYAESERLIKRAAAKASTPPDHMPSESVPPESLRFETVPPESVSLESLPPESMPLSTVYKPGDMIAGKYRLLRLIGRGGMGVVWEAHSDALDIPVAVKLIHQFTATEEEKKRLIIEAKAAARLVDPGVVRVYDCGLTLNGEPYVVMELLEGEDLAMRLDQRGRIPPIEAVRTLLPIFRALGTAHAASIVHRDVKPENVFLARSTTGEEQPKLLDFGIAKVGTSREQRLTQAGSALGSPNYMSPEQARGEEVDPRSDLWGISVVLYEAITGQLPFDGSGYNAVMYAILSADIPTFEELGVEEPELWAIISQGLERDRCMRWQSSEEYARELASWLIARGILHDVTGVSLHANRNGRRTGRERTLQSARPPRLDRTLSPSGQAVTAHTITRSPGGFRAPWTHRPRWFVPALGALGLCACAIGMWRLAKVSQPEPSRLTPTPAALAPESAPVQRPAEPTAVAPVTTAKPPEKPSEIEAALQAPLPAANVANRKSVAASAAKSPSNKTPPTSKPAVPKPGAFKSPFD